MTVSNDEKDYLWEHFKFNADQRIKAFNFFVILSVFANGGAFAAFEKKYPVILTEAIGLFIITLALIFSVIDRRSRHLTMLAIPGLKKFEEQFTDPDFRLFVRDSTEQSLMIRYSVAFNALYLAQVAFGTIVIWWGGNGLPV